MSASPSFGRRLARGSLLGALVASGLAYLTAIAYLKVNEAALVFAPNRQVAPLPDDLAARARWLPSATASGSLGELLVLTSPVARDPAPWLVFLHGNAAHVASRPNLSRYRQLLSLGVHVVAPEYPGYGRLDGSPSEAGAVEAARGAWTWLRESGVPPDRIVLYGWSLGSGVATHLAVEAEERGVVLEGAFTGVDDRASELYPWLPVRWIASHRFASRERIARISSPLLLLHARDDRVIPFGHAERMLALASGPKRLVALSGGHVVPNEADAARYEEAWRRFLDELFADRLR